MSLFLAVAAALTLLPVPVLFWVRTQCDGEEPGVHVDRAAWIASFLIASGPAMLLGYLILELPWRWPTAGWRVFAAYGAVAATTFYLTMRVALYGIGSILHRWSCRLPRETSDPLGWLVFREACMMAAFATLLATMAVVSHLASSQGLPMWAVLPLLFGLHPLYQAFGLPWLQYLRAPTLTSRQLDGIEAWLDSIRRDRNLPRFRVRVQEGRLANAAATGGLGAHLIVIGGRLLDEMPRPMVEAVLAHEIAHVVKRHVPRTLLPLLALGGAFHVGIFVGVVVPLFDGDGFLAVAARPALCAASAGLFLAYLPGLFMKKMEFQADRVAVEMLGDGKPLADALVKLGELNKQPLTARSWSHPTLQARIDAINALSVHTASQDDTASAN